MRTALYFPHTELQSQSLLKTSLLLWDRLEYIVPDDKYRPNYKDNSAARAIELIGVPRIPSQSEKQEAHGLVEDLVTRALPEAFYYRQSDADGDYYDIYPHKFLPETWEMLSRLELADTSSNPAEHLLTQTAGLSVMSILADCCAGETRSRITDRSLAYATITNLPVDPTDQDATAHYERVVSLTLELIDATTIPLEELINFREREEKESGGSLKALRHEHLQRVETHVAELKTLTRPADWKEKDRTFQSEMAKDLKRLERELGAEKRGLALSKDVVVSIAAAATAVWGATHGLPFEIPAAFTALGAPVTVGGLLSAKSKYSASRSSIMEKHPMAYLYQLRRHRD
jgi:hypothetical protein